VCPLINAVKNDEVSHKTALNRRVIRGQYDIRFYALRQSEVEARKDTIKHFEIRFYFHFMFALSSTNLQRKPGDKCVLQEIPFNGNRQFYCRSQASENDVT
jgi:hypothetical protein